MRTRWAGAVQASTSQAAAGKLGLRGSAALPGWVQGSAAQAGARGSLLKNICRNVWREMIWPCRRAWVGLAALWLVPLVARTVPQVTLIPLGVPVMLTMFVLLLRRAELAVALPMAFSAASIKQSFRE